MCVIRNRRDTKWAVIGPASLEGKPKIIDVKVNLNAQCKCLLMFIRKKRIENILKTWIVFKKKLLVILVLRFP